MLVFSTDPEKEQESPAAMKGPVPKDELGTALLHAKCAAKIVRAQRDRLQEFQLLLQLQPNLPGEDDAPALLSMGDVRCGLLLASFPSENSSKSLGVCLEIAAKHGVRPSLPRSLADLGEEELFDRVLALRLPRRPVTHAHAFARVEAAVRDIYAVLLNVQRCIEHLSYTPAATEEHPLAQGPVGTLEDNSKIGLPDPVAAATEHLAKIGLSDKDAAAAATEPTQDSSKIGLPVPAPAISDTGEALPQDTGGCLDLDQARTCLDRACTLAGLTVKHVDLAVTAISSCLDPKEVARISDCADIIAID